MTKKLLQTLTLLLITIATQAQFQGGARGPGMAANGRVYGKVQDAKSNKGLTAVSVQILQNKYDSISKTKKDKVIAGQLTQSNGEFSVEGLPVGPSLTVKITAIGYTTIEKKLQFVIDPTVMRSGDITAMINAVDKDLGNIKITQNVKQAAEVTVVADRAALQIGIDRKVFNVDKNIVSSGGNGIDIMRNVPSVQVDIDGNLTLRNNTPQLFVDGRPTTLTLEQIPADAIASVELITNPSAKFDASGGTSGIINIVLKKNKKAGYNGNLRTNLDSRLRLGLGADINIRQGKINTFLGVNYNQRKSISTGTSNRLNTFTNPDNEILQSNRNVGVGSFQFLRGGIDYFADNRNTFSFSGNFTRGNFAPTDNINIRQDTIGRPASIKNTYRNSDGKNQFQNIGGAFSFKHLFAKAGQELTADVTYNKSKNFNNNDIINGDVSNSNSLATQQQQIRANGNRQNITIQTDYVQPLAKNAKLETGLRYNETQVLSVNDNFIRQPFTTNFIYQPAVGYNFSSIEKVYAAYGTYGQKIKKTTMQLGLRWESSIYNGNLISSNQKFVNKFPNSFFPSIFITQNVGKGRDIQLNYTRKINRPNFFQLLPFVDYADSLNITKGNPALVPEFTNSLELNYQLPYGKTSSVLINAYYKKTENLIARIQNQQNIGGSDIIVNSFINANASQVYGIEFINKNNITPKIEVTTNLNLYGSTLSIPNLPVLTDALSWFAKLNSSYKLKKNYTIQLSGEYQSQSVLPPGGSANQGGGGRGGMGGGGFGGGQNVGTQGFIKAFYSVDLAVRKEFWKEKRGSISINMNDIFRTKINAIRTETNLFIQDVARRRDPQVLRINFSYRFGKQDMNLFKRKSNKSDGGGGAEM